MPIVFKKDNIIAKRLINEGVDIISEEYATHQDIREIHIGILNLMPDAALRVTESQFIKLIAACNKIIQIRVHIFTLSEIERSLEMRKYIEESYESFNQVKNEGLDALIITGATPFKESILDEAYSESLSEVISWALKNVTSIWISCLSAQFFSKKYFNVKREKMNRKLWGVFAHTVCDVTHPLTRNINTKFNCVHSRFYNIDKKQLHKYDFKTLIECDVNQQFLLAVSNDGIKTILCQGHPEYDTISLFKEYKREVNKYRNGLRSDYPPLPTSYFDKKSKNILIAYKNNLLQDKSIFNSDSFLEESIDQNDLYNTWIDTSKALFSNWLGLIYRITGYDRHKPIADGIDPNNPLKNL